MPWDEKAGADLVAWVFFLAGLGLGFCGAFVVVLQMVVDL